MWVRLGSEEEFFSSQVNPLWIVDRKENIYYIYDDSDRLLFLVEVIENSQNQQFSDFVIDRLNILNNSQNSNYSTTLLELDLDMTRVVYYDAKFPNTLYLVAGNNLMFYKINIYNLSSKNPFLRTFEFKDGLYDEISL